MGSGVLHRVVLLSVWACAQLVKAEGPGEADDVAPHAPNMSPDLWTSPGTLDLPGDDPNVYPAPHVLFSNEIQIPQNHQDRPSVYAAWNDPASSSRLPQTWHTALPQNSQPYDQKLWESPPVYVPWAPQSYSFGHQQQNQPSRSQDASLPIQPPAEKQEFPLGYEAWWSQKQSASENQYLPPSLTSTPQDPNLKLSLSYEGWNSQQPSFQSGPYQPKPQLSSEARYQNVGKQTSLPSSTNERNLLVASEEESSENVDTSVQLQAWGFQMPAYPSGQDTGPEPTNDRLQARYQNVGARPSLPPNTKDQNVADVESLDRYQAWRMQQSQNEGPKRLRYPTGPQVRPQHLRQSFNLLSSKPEPPSDKVESSLRYEAWGSQTPGYQSGQSNYNPAPSYQPSGQPVESSAAPYQAWDSYLQHSSEWLNARQQTAGGKDNPNIPETSKKPLFIFPKLPHTFQRPDPSFQSGQQQHPSVPMSPEQLNNVDSKLAYQAWKPNYASQFKPQIVPKPPSYPQESAQYLRPASSLPSRPNLPSAPQQLSKNVESLSYREWESQNIGSPSGQPLNERHQNVGERPSLSQSTQGQNTASEQTSSVRYQASWSQQSQNEGPKRLRYPTGPQVRPQHSRQPLSLLSSKPEPPSDKVESSVRYEAWGSQTPSSQSGQDVKPQSSNVWLQSRQQNVGGQLNLPSSVPVIPKKQLSNNADPSLAYQAWGSGQSSFQKLTPQNSQPVSHHNARQPNLPSQNFAATGQRPSDNFASNRYQSWGSQDIKNVPSVPTSAKEQSQQEKPLIENSRLLSQNFPQNPVANPEQGRHSSFQQGNSATWHRRGEGAHSSAPSKPEQPETKPRNPNNLRLGTDYAVSGKVFTRYQQVQRPPQQPQNLSAGFQSGSQARNIHASSRLSQQNTGGYRHQPNRDHQIQASQQSQEVVGSQAGYLLRQNQNPESSRPSEHVPGLLHHKPQSRYSDSQLSFQTSPSQNKPFPSRDSKGPQAVRAQVGYLFTSSRLSQQNSDPQTSYSGPRLNYNQQSQNVALFPPSQPAAPLSRPQQPPNSGISFSKPSYPQRPQQSNTDALPFETYQPIVPRRDFQPSFNLNQQREKNPLPKPAQNSAILFPRYPLPHP